MIEYGVAFKEGNEHKPFSLGFQDAYCSVSTNGIYVGVICDGCSTRGINKFEQVESNDFHSPRSDSARFDGFTRNHVGAVLGSEVLSHAVYRHLIKKKHTNFNKIFKEALDETIDFFRNMMKLLTNTIHLDVVRQVWDKESFINDKLMFTLIGIAVTNEKYWIFGVGDGCYGTHDSYNIIETPKMPYINHKLTNPTLEYTPIIYKEGVLDIDSTLWIASDGLIPILMNKYAKTDFFSFLADERATSKKEKNDNAIQAFRARVLRNNRDILLEDDMTLLVVKFKTEKVNNNLTPASTALAFQMKMPIEWTQYKEPNLNIQNINADNKTNIPKADIGTTKTRKPKDDFLVDM